MSKLRFFGPRPLAALLPLVVLVAGASHACAQTVINTVPYSINASGKYVVGTNLNYSGDDYAISINAPNVDLDFDGYYVAGPGNTASTSGVINVADVANVTIHGGIVAGAGLGIVFSADTNSRNYRVENMTISRIYHIGIFFAGAAPGSQVRNCSLSNIGGSTATSNVFAAGISSAGGVRVENNLIANVTGTGVSPGYGIGAGASDFSVGNTVSNCQYGILGGKYLDNLTSNCQTPFTSGTNATGNN